MKHLASMAAALIVASMSEADVAPKGMTKFNVVCPSRALCPRLEAEYQRCSVKRQEDVCAPFVDAMNLSFSRYDCQRPFDHTETADYIVPALWMCAEPRRAGGAPREEAYVKLLSELAFREARCAFASPALRSVLDGDLAEMYLDRSLESAETVECPNDKGPRK